MRDFFADLFEYNHHYNEQLFKAFTANNGNISERSEEVFNHILLAHHTWNNRILKEQNQYGIWELKSLQELGGIEKENFKISNAILRDFDLDIFISYTNSRGENFTNGLKDILFHIINHSTYHRGQIASDFRKTGMEPLVSDYIFYKRQ